MSRRTGDHLAIPGQGQRGHGGVHGKGDLSDEAKRLTTRILPSDEPQMVERKKRAQKKIDRKRRRRKKVLEAQRRAELLEPKEPPAIDYSMFSEEEIAIMSDVFAREIDFARDMHAVER